MSYPTTNAAITVPAPAAQPTYFGPEGGVGPKTAYVRTLNGLLKIGEFVLAVVVIICAACFNLAVPNNSVAGYISFVSSAQCFFTIVLFMLFFFNVVYRIPHHALIILIYYGVIELFILIGAIICAVYGGTYPASGAAAFFLFVDLIVCGLDAFICLRYWRSADVSLGHKVLFGAPPPEPSAQPASTQYPGGGAPHY